MSVERSLPWFKFDVSEYLSGNIQAFSMEKQGIFLNICARAWKDGGSVAANGCLHTLLRVEKQLLYDALQELLDAGCLIRLEDGTLSTKFMQEQLAHQTEISAKRSEAGSKGGRPASKSKRKQLLSNCKAKAKQTLSISTSISSSLSESGIHSNSQKMAYGELGKVLLTEEEYGKLQSAHPPTELQRGIEILDGYLAANPRKKYANHYAVLKRDSWVWERVAEKTGGAMHRHERSTEDILREAHS